MRKLLLALMLMISALNVTADNYPYRVDYLWVTVPDHADWLYECGENATIEVQFYKYGIPRDGRVNWKLSNDMLKTDKQGTATLKNGRCKINIGSRKTPGFRDLNLAVEIDGKTYVHHIKVGFSVDKIMPLTKEPSDFMAFWDTQKKSLKRELSYTRERAEEYCTDKILCDLIKLNIDNKHSVYAYLTYPRNAERGKHPICICPPGAGIKTIREPMRHKYYAENGFIRLEMEIHGIDPRTPESTFREIQAAFQTDGNNYLENGLDNRDNYYMRHVYLSLIRAVDFTTSLPEWDGKNVAFQGGSQGGALSLEQP